jgi:hypothetical protein
MSGFLDDGKKYWWIGIVLSCRQYELLVLIVVKVYFKVVLALMCVVVGYE